MVLKVLIFSSMLCWGRAIAGPTQEFPIRCDTRLKLNHYEGSAILVFAGHTFKWEFWNYTHAKKNGMPLVSVDPSIQSRPKPVDKRNRPMLRLHHRLYASENVIQNRSTVLGQSEVFGIQLGLPERRPCEPV